MKNLLMLTATLACTLLPAHAAEPLAGPYIDSGGPAFAVKDRDVPLPADHHYRVVFEATEYPGETSEVNRELTVVARFLNMHGQNGVPLDKMDIAVVMHGQALLAAMKNDTYRELTGNDNPNLQLLQSLADAGVRFYACGQSLGFRQLDKNVLIDPVKVGLSAMTMLVTLQHEGYAFLP